MTAPDPVAKFLDWLIAMDDPQNEQGAADRQTVTLTRIIQHARDVKLYRELDAETADLEIERLRAIEQRAIEAAGRLRDDTPTSRGYSLAADYILGEAARAATSDGGNRR